MNIVIFAPNYLPATRYGGPVQSSHGLARSLVRLGHNVQVFTTNEDGPDRLDVPLDTPVLIDGVIVRYYAIAAPRRLYRSPSLRKGLKRGLRHADVLHINGAFLWPGPMAAKLARRMGVPYVHSPRGMLTAELIQRKSRLVKRCWIALFEERCIRLAAAVHATSALEASDVRELCPRSAPIVVIPNGVEAPVERGHHAGVDHWAPVPPGSRVAFLGRLDWKKGVDLAIEAVLHCPGVRLRIAGYDQMDVAALIARHDPEGERVAYVGPLVGQEKWSFLAHADLLVVASSHENFGNVVPEALVMGTPVICTRRVGAATIVQRLDPASVVERDVQEIAGAIARLLGNDVLRGEISAAGERLVRAEYSWDGVAGRMAEVYAASARARKTARPIWHRVPAKP